VGQAARLGGVMSLVVMAGCGILTSQQWDTSSYKSPNWTGDGHIIAVKETLKHERNLTSDKVVDFKSIIVEMDPDGGNEHDLFSIDGSQTVKVVERSTSGNIVAYLHDFGLLKVYRLQGGVWSQITAISLGQAFDLVKISPDESKIYVSYGTSEFIVFDVYGNELRRKSGGGGNWKSANQILFYDFDKSLIVSYLVNSDSTTDMPTYAYPEVYFPSENAIYYQSSSFDEGPFRVRQDLLTERVVTTNFSYSPNTYNDFMGQHLSPDGTRIVMGAHGIEQRPSGIYVLNIQLSTTVQLR